MRNWYNNLTPNLSISPLWFLAPLRSLTRRKNPWTCTYWPDGRMISVGNQFSRLVVSDALWSHGLQHTRLPCPSLTPRACSNSYSLSGWYNPTILPSDIPFSSSHPLLSLLLPLIFPSIRVFLHIIWPKYWSFRFNIIPTSEHPGLISFRID